MPTARDAGEFVRLVGSRSSKDFAFLARKCGLGYSVKDRLRRLRGGIFSRLPFTPTRSRGQKPIDYLSQFRRGRVGYLPALDEAAERVSADSSFFQERR